MKNERKENEKKLNKKIKYFFTFPFLCRKSYVLL